MIFVFLVSGKLLSQRAPRPAERKQALRPQNRQPDYLRGSVLNAYRCACASRNTNLHIQFLVNENVFGLQIAVEHPLGVTKVHGIKHLVPPCVDTL